MTAVGPVARGTSRASPTNRMRRGLAAVTTLAIALLPRLAAADPTVEQCVEQHESAQRLRHAGELLASRDLLERCAEPSCPSLIAADCTEWRNEVERLIPSLIFGAKSEEGDLVDVSVTLDGRLLATELDGASVEVDPGPHELVFERPGSPPIVRRVVARKGVKDRVVSVYFAASPALRAEPEVAPAVREMHRPVPVATFVVGAAALATLGVGIGLGTHAMTVKEARREACAPLCGSSEKAEVTKVALAADVLFGASALTAGAALVIFLVRPEVPLEEEPPVTVGVDPSGGWLALRGRF